MIELEQEIRDKLPADTLAKLELIPEMSKEREAITDRYLDDLKKVYDLLNAGQEVGTALLSRALLQTYRVIDENLRLRKSLDDFIKEQLLASIKRDIPNFGFRLR
jgi:hypothetical protein